MHIIRRPDPIGAHLTPRLPEIIIIASLDHRFRQAPPDRRRRHINRRWHGRQKIGIVINDIGLVEIDHLFRRRRRQIIIQTVELGGRRESGIELLQSAARLARMRPIGIIGQIGPIGLTCIDAHAGAPCLRFTPGRQQAADLTRIHTAGKRIEKILIGADRIAPQRRRIGIILLKILDRCAIKAGPLGRSGGISSCIWFGLKETERTL